MGDVRNVYGKEIVLPLPAHADRIVKIAGILPVDGDDEVLPKIPPALGQDGLRACAARLLKDFLRKFLGKVLTADDGVFLHGKIAAPAQHLADLSLGVFPLGIVDDVHHHLFARKGTQSADDAHGPGKPALVRLHHAAFPVAVIGTRQARHSAAQDAVHFRLVPAVAADNAAQDGIPVQSAVQRTVRKEQIFPLFPDEKGKAALVALQRSPDEAKLGREHVPAAIVAHDLPCAFQLLQQAQNVFPLRLAAHAEQAENVRGLFMAEFSRIKFFAYVFYRRH